MLPLHRCCVQAKGDADKERQELVLSAKNKIAADYDRKEKQLAMDQRMCVNPAPAPPSPTAAQLQP